MLEKSTSNHYITIWNSIKGQNVNSAVVSNIGETLSFSEQCKNVYYAVQNNVIET